MSDFEVLGTIVLSLLGFMFAVLLTIVGLLFLSEKFLENNFRK